ncbi:uncharacterized protein LOC122814050 [Protopterus annectens]|uniref:uncharacterized protein LOC122814050 n=1 Tax=Protopterus annectens TaxID=7888 RepID=UPI001CFA4869|nr:uncharacterized protein LOC122814050 [Protopterus annectens]
MGSEATIPELSVATGSSIGRMASPPSLMQGESDVTDVCKAVTELKKKSTPTAPLDVTGDLMDEVSSSYSSSPPESTDTACSEGYWTGSEDSMSVRSVSSACSIGSMNPPPYMVPDNPPVVCTEASDLQKSGPSAAACSPGSADLALCRAPDSEPGAGPESSSSVQCHHRQITITQNRMVLDKFRKEFHKALQQEEKNSDNFVKTLKTTPKEMKAKLERCVEELLASCKNELEGEEEKKQEHLMLLAGQIQEDLENYTSGYAKKFKTSATKAGAAAGAAGIGLLGGVVCAGVVLATEALLIAGSKLATVAVGALAGTGTFALVGGGVGAKLGSTFGKKKKKICR